MQVSVSLLYAKIGQLVVENELLRSELQRFERETADAKKASEGTGQPVGNEQTGS